MLTCLISHSSCLSVLVVFAEACRVTDQPSLFSPATQAPVSRGYDVETRCDRSVHSPTAERRDGPDPAMRWYPAPTQRFRSGRRRRWQRWWQRRRRARGGGSSTRTARGTPHAKHRPSPWPSRPPRSGITAHRRRRAPAAQLTARRSLSHISHTAQNAPPPLRHRPRARERILHTCRVLVQNDSVTPFGFAVPIMWVQTQTPPPPRRARSALPGNESRSSHSHSRTDRSWAWRPGTRPWACCRRTQAPSCCPM